MSKKLISYKSKDGTIMFAVKRMKNWDRKELVFYLTTENPERYVNLKSLETVVTEKWQSANPVVIKDPHKVAAFLNQQGFNPKDKISTRFIFEYSTTKKKEPFTEMFEYTVPKESHEVIVVSPTGQEIVDY